MKPQWWQAILLVGAGGFIGAVARWMLATWVDQFNSSKFPWGIFAVNALGCLLIGLAVGVLNHAGWRFVIVTGFLGSLTTFSTFSYDTLNLIRDGRMALALTNVGLSIVVGLFAVWVGYTIAGVFRSS
ncbi:MAG: CrcB protein [Verrucomicrobiales bacterium]|jgi:CrcB protein